jgi:hypothetical protein
MTPRKRSRYFCPKYLLAIACCIVLATIGIVAGWNRPYIMQLALQQFIGRTSLLAPKVSGFQFGFDQAMLAEMEFDIETDVGLLSVKLEDIQVNYNLNVYSFNTSNIKAINIGHAQLKLAYHAAANPAKVKDEALSGAINYPSGRLTVANLDVESNTPWGLSHFTGNLEINAGKADGVKATFLDANHAIHIRFSPEFSTAKVVAEPRKGGKIFELNAGHLNQPDKSARLRADVSAAIDWLSTSTLVPETWRTTVSASIMPRMASSLSPMQLDLDIGTPDNLATSRGMALLTRNGHYLAKSNFSLPKPDTIIADGDLDMAVTEAVEWLNPWLPETVKMTNGHVQGNINLRWQSQSIVTGEAQLKISDMACTVGAVQVEHGNIEANLNDLSKPSIFLSVDVPSVKLGKAMVAHSLIAKARLLDHELTLEQAGLSLFGGILEVLPSTVNIDRQPVLLTLRVSDVDLTQLLSSLNYPDLTATGNVNGDLPLRLASDSIELQDGFLNGTRPGMLRYQGPVNEKENLAFRALRNLEYHRLSTKLNYRPDGNYHLGLHLEGSNPEVLSGHPLVFNLNLSGHLPELLQKGIMSGDFGKTLVEEVNPTSAKTKKPAKSLLPSPLDRQQPQQQPTDRRSQ